MNLLELFNELLGEVRQRCTDESRARLRVTCTRLYALDPVFAPLAEWTRGIGLRFRLTLLESQMERWSRWFTPMWWDPKNHEMTFIMDTARQPCNRVCLLLTMSADDTAFARLERADYCESDDGGATIWVDNTWEMKAWHPVVIVLYFETYLVRYLH